jgi:hypothetical protein
MSHYNTPTLYIITEIESNYSTTTTIDTVNKYIIMMETKYPTTATAIDNKYIIASISNEIENRH